jgi:NAD(P)-dependent dehydrogenase (short-subunit alcohol dehydrogenase family)
VSPDRFSLEGRVVVVTGGLGQLGRQFTTALHEHGATVAVLDLETPSPQLGDSSTGVMHVRADVTDRDSLTSALRQIADASGTPYALVNNAALDAPPGASASENGPFEEYPLASWQQILEVNLTGVFLACQVFGGAMAEAGRGSIINVASIYGMVSPDQRLYEYRRRSGEGFFKPAAYSASKSGLLNLTRYLATYWADRGVRVNTLTPGGVFNSQDPAFVAAYSSRVPLGRMGRPDEYNGAIVFLCSDASSYMTGANLVIDGGWTAW